MKRILNIFLFVLCCNLITYGQHCNVFPINESRYHPTRVPIIIRPGYIITDDIYAQFAKLCLEGSQSGRVPYQLYRSTDQKVVTYVPNRPFLLGEQVTCSLNGLKKPTGGLTDITTRFYIESSEHALLSDETTSRDNSEEELLPLRMTNSGAVYPYPIFATVILSRLRYFLLNIFGELDYSVDSDHFMVNFQKHNDSLYSVTDKSIFVNGNILLDKSFVPIDTIYAPEGYELDFHDFRVTSRGNYLFLIEEVHTIDMSQIYPGGKPNALVKSNAIMELDSATQLPINIWRAIDHFSVLDGVHDNVNVPELNFTASVISFTHANSIQETHDGYWILSCRNMDAVTKIDPQTGSIVWRLGGKNNQFQFVNDSLGGISNQHHATLLPNNHLLIYDNGMFHNPPIARAVEYVLNEADSTATLVFSATHPNGDRSFAGGSHQLLPNGNHFISWGSLDDNQPHDVFMSEYDSLGNAVNHISLDSSVYQITHTPYVYRAYKYEWSPSDTISDDTIPNDTTIDTTNLAIGVVLESSIDIYPQPCSEVIDIRLPRSMAWLPENKIRLYDVLGHCYQPPQQLLNHNNICRLNLESLPPNIYFLLVQHTRGTQTFKILKL